MLPTRSSERLHFGGESAFLENQLVLFIVRGERQEPIDLREPVRNAAREERIDARLDGLFDALHPATLLHQFLEYERGVGIEWRGQLVDRGLRIMRSKLLEDRAVCRVGESLRANTLGGGLHVAAMMQQCSHELALGSHTEGTTVGTALALANVLLGDFQGGRAGFARRPPLSRSHGQLTLELLA